MAKLFNFISRLCLVALIIFSLQGKVLKRYVLIFKGQTEHVALLHHTPGQGMFKVKLQSFSQRFDDIAIPEKCIYADPLFSVTVLQKSVSPFNACIPNTSCPRLLLLRGPPATV